MTTHIEERNTLMPLSSGSSTVPTRVSIVQHTRCDSGAQNNNCTLHHVYMGRPIITKCKIQPEHKPIPLIYN